MIESFVLNTCEGRNGTSPRVQGYEAKQTNLFVPFRIDDPFGLRSAIVPVFCEHTDGRRYGVGTAFHFDGFNNFLSAHHVVDFVSKKSDKRPVLFLSMQAVIFGTVPIPSDCFVPVAEVKMSMMEADDPLAALQGQSTRRPALDVVVLKAEKIGPGARLPQTLPVRTGRLIPKVGELVLAVGFPQLDLSEMDHAKQLALLTEGMYGAYGRIVAIHATGTSSSNPTPVFEVESDWPSGMSGGPVFNRSGEVIGIVSRSLRAEPGHHGTAYAVHLGLAKGIELLTCNLDQDNPGWRLCWGIFRSGDTTPNSMHLTEDAAAAAAALLTGPIEIKHISHRVGTTEYVLAA